MKSMWFYIRKNARKTQKDVANDFGCSVSYIHKIESGKDKMPVKFQIYYLKMRNAEEDKIVIEYLERGLEGWNV